MSNSQKPRKDPYQEVTDRIVAKLDEGVVVWHRPWDPAVGQPRNLDGRAYTGVNSLLLGLTEFSDPRWGTFKSIAAKGGTVKKGEKGTHVVFFKSIPIQEKQEDGSEKPKTIPFLRLYTVFNVEQTEGLELAPIEVTPLIPEADEILAGYQGAPSVSHGGTRAFYHIDTDSVYMPSADAFESSNAYYLVLWHELVHSTGAKKRLDRKDIADLAEGDEPRAREELTAEIGSAMLAARVDGVEPNVDQSAAYIQFWKARLKADPKLIVSAASRASKAANHILGEE